MEQRLYNAKTKGVLKQWCPAGRTWVLRPGVLTAVPIPLLLAHAYMTTGQMDQKLL